MDIYFSLQKRGGKSIFMQIVGLVMTKPDAI